MSRTKFPFRIFFVLVILGLSVPVRGLAQDGLGKGRLTGIVTDDGGNPVPRAKVVLRFLEDGQRSFETTTDKSGRWSVLGLGYGDWNVRASADGHESASRNCFVRQLTPNPRVPLVLAKIQSQWRDLGPAGLLDKANEFFYAKKYGEAAATYLEYLQFDPEDVMARLSAGDCYRENGEFQKGIEQFGRIVEMTSKDPFSREILARGLTGLGECYFKTGDLEKAESYFRSSIKQSPDNEVVAYNLGEVCFSLRKVDEAIRYYSLAARISPNWSDPLSKLGYVYLNTSQYEKAKEIFKKFLKLEATGVRAAQAKKALENIEKIKK